MQTRCSVFDHKSFGGDWDYVLLHLAEYFTIPLLTFAIFVLIYSMFVGFVPIFSFRK